MESGVPILVSYDGDGNPVGRRLRRTELRSGAPSQPKEHVLQALIDQQPDVLPWREFFPAANTLYSLGREIPVELGDHVGERSGFIDNLLVTDDGHLVLVETKLWRNPEAIREVIAQVMEYAMALGKLGLDGLEQAIRRGDPRSCRLGPEEGIVGRMQATAGSDGDAALLDEFEDAFARFRQTGELLVLIVADGIRTSVERLATWFGEQFSPGSPIRLGLVELRFYDREEGHLVVPATRLRTKELGRHVVVVEVKEGKASEVAVSVRDVEAGRPVSTRQVAKPDVVLTKDSFLARARSELSADQMGAVEGIVAGLDQLGLTTRGTATEWHYGVSDDSGIVPLVAFGGQRIYCNIPARLRAALGDQRFVDCKRILARIAPFYRPEDVDDPSKVNALMPKYDVLIGQEREFVRAIGEVADIARTALAERT